MAGTDCSTIIHLHNIHFEVIFAKLIIGNLPRTILLMSPLFLIIVQDKDGRNALHLASLNGHASLARDLMTIYRLHPNTASKVLESCVDTVMFRYLSQIVY